MTVRENRIRSPNNETIQSSSVAFQSAAALTCRRVVSNSFTGRHSVLGSVLINMCVCVCVIFVGNERRWHSSCRTSEFIGSRRLVVSRQPVGEIDSLRRARRSNILPSSTSLARRQRHLRETLNCDAISKRAPRRNKKKDERKIE